MNHNFNILSQPWAITQECLELVARELQAAKEASFQLPLDREDIDKIQLNIHNGVAIISITGTLYPRDSWYSQTSYEQIREQVNAAVSDSAVQAIVLKISSPGGLVSGCKELADFIFQAGKTKHIYAYADGQMCSAAYWIGSAARDIAAPVTADIGSIGVRMIHIDWSKFNDEMGLKYTHLAAGSYKTLGNEDEPLNKKAKDYFQAQLDTLYTIFVDSVAKNRRVDTEKALAMADGKVFLAEEALKVGLIDRIEQDFQSYFTLILKKEKIMDIATLKADYPDLYSTIFDEGKSAAVAENEEKVKAAVAEETARITGIVGAIAGKETAEKITAVVKSGASVEMVESLKDLFVASEEGKTDDTTEANSTTRADILAALQNAHSDGVNLENGTESTQGKSLEEQAKELASLAN